MTAHNGRLPRGRLLFLAPEAPTLGGGGGGMRSASLLQYLQGKYEVDVATFQLRAHSKSTAAKMWRNGMRLLRSQPPLYDRFRGYQSQIEAQMHDRQYEAAVVEHFWCASYADVLRPRCRKLVLDLHNIESELAKSHASAAAWPESWASASFSRTYRNLERKWLPKFDAVLVASEEDAGRIEHPLVQVYPNAIPVLDRPETPEPAQPSLIFTGNLEYHPNVEAVRWFRTQVWPRVREAHPTVEWRLAGINPGAVRAIVEGDRRIHLIGPVDDAVAALAEAQVAIVPLQSGSGTRFKILEAWAAARPVVSTTIGAEGLGALDGKHLLIADDAAAFAAAVLRALDNAALRRDLGDAGRQRYLERFTWPQAWSALELSGVL